MWVVAGVGDCGVGCVLGVCTCCSGVSGRIWVC